MGALFVWPFAAIVGRGLDGGGFGAVGDVLGDPWVRGVVWFSAWQAALSTVVTFAIGLPCAWVFGRRSFVGRRLLWSALVVPFVMPTVVVASAFTTLSAPDGPLNRLLATLGWGSPDSPALVGPGSVWILVVAHAFFNVAVVIRVVGTAWGDIDTRLTESAAVLGASPARVLRSVTVPLLTPSIVASGAIVYLFTFTSFGVVLLLGAGRRRTIEVEIYEQVRLLDLSTAAALALVQVVVVVAVLALASRVQRQRTVASSHPAGGRRRARGALERLLVGASLTVLALLVAVPLLVLVVRSVQTTSGVALTYWEALGRSGRDTVAGVSALAAARNSLVLGAAAATVAMVVGVLAAAALVTAERRHGRRTRSASRGAFDALLMLPLGVSAVTIGLGFVVALDRPPLDLRDSVALIPLAQALVAIPFVVRTVLPAWRAVDGRWRDAASVLGASPLRVAWEVDRPLLARPLAVAASFAFAIAVGEFGATALLAGPDTPTLPVAIGRLLGRPGEMNRGQAMAASTLLMVLTAAIVMAVEWRRERTDG
ncbi:MAG: iron ABC transporter permease [Acidimicrobiia bacterium]|nr:iron ABC transporter permease [Acidimicrobiia bacterium]